MYRFEIVHMPIAYPDVSRDFPKLIKTIATLDEFDFWDDLIMGIYKNAENPALNLQSYFKSIRWIHLNKPYPTCPEITSDWSLIEDIYVTNVEGTKYKVEKDALFNSPLKDYAVDKSIPSLLTT